MMDYAGWILAALGWGCAIWAVKTNLWRQAYYRALAHSGETFDQLEALRDNCFITNEKGHRVRYWKASAERRAKAEGDVP